MRKINKDCKSKRAFTLVEIVLVVGIIVILASALLLNVTDILNTTKNANNAVADASDELGQRIDDSEKQLSQYHF